VGDYAPIRRAFGPADLAPELAVAGVEATVLVQTRSSIEETEEFLATAATTPFIRGVVGWIDLTDPAAGDEIARLKAGSGGDRLVGMRHQAHDEPDAAWLARRDVGRGVAAIGDAGLVYDVLVRTRELPAALALVTNLPDVRFVVDHLAKPPIRSGDLDAWRTAVTAFAGLPNVWWKLAGLVTEADWTDWRPADLQPAVEHCLGLFGPERLIFGSDWPVCLVAASYGEVFDAARDLVRGPGLSAAEEAAVFGGTASVVYGV
jgi:L-fuconolactonase